MKKVLFIDNTQFGYLTDTYKYCQYLCHDYRITYLSFNREQPKYFIPNGKTIYVPHTKSKNVNGLLFLLYSIIVAFFFNGSIFIVYFPYCSILKHVLFWKRMHVDVRTLSVSPDKSKRNNDDRQLAKEVLKFDTCSFISEGIRQKLKILSNANSFVLPLGSDVISKTNKKFDFLHLLYIGTLYNRNIIETIEGVCKFVEKNPTIRISYDIIGDGEELEQLKAYVQKNKLSDVVFFHGRKKYEELEIFLDKCNIGVSYIPIVDYYQYQPPTKTFEYAFSGLAVLATATEANKEIVNGENGLLIEDTPEAFANSLVFLSENMLNYSSERIRKSVEEYSWEKIVRNKLMPIID